MEVTYSKAKGCCAVCGKTLVIETKTWSEYRGDPMLMIIGPGSRNQMTQASSTAIYCKYCGLLYHVDPGELA